MKNKSLVSLLFILTLSLSVSVQGAIKGASQKSAAGSSKVLQSKGQTNAPKGTPTWEIQEIERKLEAYETGKQLTAEQRSKNAKLKREILNGTFDLRELSRLSLDRHWNNISTSERTNFVNLMTSLLETKAIFSKEHSKTQGKSYTVTYKGDQFYENRRRAKSVTQIYVPKENVTLDIEYRLKTAGSSWKVFDIIVDGASLVENYRYQFNQIIKKHGYPDLVRRMRAKLAKLKSK